MKGKSVETKFEKPLVIRQPNAFKRQRQSVLGKLAKFSNSLAKIDFSKSKSVTTNNVSNEFSNLVTAQILPQNVKSILKNTNVIAPGMYKVHTKPNQTRTPQLPQDISKTNKRVSFSTGVIPTTSVSKPQLKINRLEDRVMHNNSEGNKQQVEDHHRNFKFSNNKTSVTVCNDSLNAKTSNVNFICVTCRKCVLNDNHDMCVLHYINGVNSRTKMPMAVPITRRYNFIHRRLWVLKAHDGKSQASKDLVLRNVTIKRVYYVEGLNHNLFSIGQFYDADLEVAFRKSTCYISDLKGNDLLTGSYSTDLYSITLQDTSTPNPIYLMAKATSSQAWLWHRRLSQLNFDTINLLSKYDIVTGLPKLKFVKDHLCSSCELGKAKRKSFKTKTTPSSKRSLQILHMDLCGPMRVESFNDHVSFDPVPQCPTMALEHDNLSLGPQSQETVPQATETVTTSNELDLLFNIPPLNIETTPETTTQAPTVTANENIIQAETNKECVQVDKDEFINIFSTPVQEPGETSSRYVDSSNMYTFYQRHPSEHRWTKDHPLE
ncbi:gag-pol polyprotein [Tanacetum coccineum]